MMSTSFPLNRRSLLKAGGAMIVGFSIGAPLEALAQAPGARPRAPGTPDPKSIDTWLAIHEDNTATLYIGFVELGQGASTALPQVAAEELDMPVDSMTTMRVETGVTPNQGGTYSSSAIARGSPQVRAAAAEARLALLTLASAKLNTPVEQLSVTDGVVYAGDQSVTYGDLVGGKRFDVAFTGNAPTKDRKDYMLVGTAYPRRDMRAKMDGSYTFLQHLTLPDMLHGRIVRPRGQRAYGAGAKVLKVDESSVANIDGVKVLRKGDFIGVVAPTEWAAVQAAQKLKVTWDDTPSLPAFDDLYKSMREAKTKDAVVLSKGDFGSAFDGAAHTASALCYGPYQSHGLFAPNCALANVRDDEALVICTSQDIYNTRNLLSNLLDIQVDKVRVQYVDGSGTYGKSCYDDAAQAAALMSQMAGQPVRVQFMRWDEMGWDLYGPAVVGEVRAAADANGKLTAYAFHGWAHHWSLIETSQQLALETPTDEWPFGVSQEVNPRTCGGMYAIPNQSLINHRVPGDKYLRAGWLRSPLDLAFSFTSEQAIDDLAYQLGKDPYVFRKANMADDRWEGVLDAVAKGANWQLRPAAKTLSKDEVVTGRGIGLGTHLASRGGAVAEIEVNKRTGKVRITHLYGTIDAGLLVNPGNVEAQIMGQLVQAASRMLHEEVTFNEKGVTSLDWNSYPVQRFKDCPEVTPILIQRLNDPSSGAGEECMAAAAAAVANAFFDATGKRMHQFPFTPERVLKTLSKT